VNQGTSAAHVARGGLYAIDIPAPAGVKFYPIHPGLFTVAVIDPGGEHSPCGTYCEIDWRYGGAHWMARYCHASHIFTGWRGRQVDIETPLGLVGASGGPSITGPHLHLVIEVDGIRVEPERAGEWVSRG